MATSTLSDRKFSFTKQSIKDLPLPTSGDVTYRDTHPNAGGLALRVTAGGAKTFLVVRRVGNTVKRFKIETFDYATCKLEALRKEAARISSDITGATSAKKVEKAKGLITLETAFNDMMSAKNHAYKEKTKIFYRRMFKNHLAYASNKPLIEFDGQYVVTMKNKMDKVGKRVSNVSLGLLRNVFNYAMTAYAPENTPIFIYNPVSVLTARKLWNREKRSKDGLQPANFNKYITSIIKTEIMGPTRTVPNIYHISSSLLMFMLFTGLRPTEASNITRDMLDHDRRIIKFGAKEADLLIKNRKEYSLPLNETAYQQLIYAGSYHKSKYFFPAFDGEPIRQTTMKVFIDRAAKQFGIRQTMKSLRSTFISIGEASGLSHFIVKALVNHDDGSENDVTDGYKVPYYIELKAATEKIESYIYEHSKLDPEFVRNHVERKL